ncbi:YhcN/YlaJ family sporulation lipoprotein [Aquibacillus kalidii]|uniref:YhcN/YlaJ family sporulation lipoprotein n=1 Tax=Aquibacillus kalidii TaxID=2762597 RepID=UPI0016485D10|nr:YhcN/YlaJ family sporulation lipoprotein [Aquibacillus kalidii]
MILTKPKHILSILLLTILISGCNTDENDNRITMKDSDGDVTKISNTSPIDQSLTNKAKEYVRINNEIESLRGINTEEDLLLAINVEQIQQFKEQNHESRIQKKLEKIFPETNIEVSSDQKIYIEVEKLEQEIQNNALDKEELKKRFDKIKKLINDEA